MSYKLKYIESARFMATSLSNFAINLAEWNPKIKCKTLNAKGLMKTWKNDFLILTKFLAMISINFFSCKNLFIHINR